MRIRDAALNCAFKTQKIVIPEWGGQEVTVRELDALTRGKVLNLFTSTDAAAKAAMWASILVDVTIAAVVEWDAEAKAWVKAFEPAHRESLTKSPGKPLQQIFETATAMSDMQQKDFDNAEKNSEGANAVSPLTSLGISAA